MNSKSLRPSFRGLRQAGMSLLETVVALAILLIATVGIMSLAGISMSTTEDQGHLAARTTEYAQDKMEQLISLAWGDTTSDTTVFPAANSGGTGLAIGGSSNPNAPATGYVDYLDLSGNPLTISNGVAPANWFYIRVWQISSPSANLKQITITSKVRSEVGSKGVGSLPQSTLVQLKTFPF